MVGITHPLQWRIWPTLWILFSSLGGRINSLLLPLLGRPVTAAPEDDEILSLDLEENDYLYRVRRNARIVYVCVLDGDIIPQDCRTDGYRVLSKLRAVPRWNEDWKTLTIRRSPRGVESTQDEFLPHGLDIGLVDGFCDRFVNLLDLTKVERISDRLSRVRCRGEVVVLKIARFRYEIPALRREVSVYSTLSSVEFPLAPKFRGFVYEETKTRVVGFVMEEVKGETPDIRHLNDCIETIRLLHSSGIMHGDVNKYNFLVTEQGVKVFGFEEATVQENVDPAAAEEIESLARRLKDESGIGKR